MLLHELMHNWMSHGDARSHYPAHVGYQATGRGRRAAGQMGGFPHSAFKCESPAGHTPSAEKPCDSDVLLLDFARGDTGQGCCPVYMRRAWRAAKSCVGADDGPSLGCDWRRHKGGLADERRKRFSKSNIHCEVTKVF